MEKEATAPKRVRKSSRAPVIIVFVILAALAAAYFIFCGVAESSHTFFPNYSINDVAVGGMTQDEAAKALEKKLPNVKVDICITGKDGTAKTTTVSALGFSQDGSYTEVARTFYEKNRSGSFFTAGWRYLRALSGSDSGFSPYVADQEKLQTVSASIAEELSVAPVDSAYELKDTTVTITKSKDGYTINADDLAKALEEAVTSRKDDYRAEVSAQKAEAKTLSVQEIYDAVAAKAKNAGYDASTGTITAEKTGAEFDVDEAKKLLDEAKDGETVKISAAIVRPDVTAEQLKSVLFRNVLGTCTTHVGGSSARISNVRLAARSINGVVLNSGETFSYNGTVGQRTKAKGYQEAPAYVQGNTVNEVGGGVCQPSSTLYLACLNSNLQIVQRSAHRYVPAYMPKGMDATVSWTSPDYKFKNNTDYPIKISAVYSGGYLTVKLIGTNISGNYVKMTNKVVSTTPSKVVKEETSSLPAGTQSVKVTPYTGYKVITYRNVYSSSGALISTKQESVSNYRARDKVILVGTGKTSGSSSSGSSSTVTPDPGTGDSATTGDTGEGVVPAA